MTTCSSSIGCTWNAARAAAAVNESARPGAHPPLANILSPALYGELMELNKKVGHGTARSRTTLAASRTATSIGRLRMTPTGIGP